ncbi:Aminoadipate reductase [Mycena indigotica]|uniref:Aminoadipate reductase n=1 Tax=Mycena indigotica TaxID=2126181 RepID=A0A8H6TES8_9AGAR|nr:Aminoadipate reductase [Mycena indigotica]KAF7316041.1 Aminoadipate reductase [Mycena indigotica]
MEFVAPPLDGSLNVIEAVDFHIQQRNLTPIFSFSDESDIVNITHWEFARATHRVAHLLRPTRDGPEGEVVAILALVDTLLYQTLFAGCSKAGFIPFPISPRNSPAALIHLLTATKTSRIYTTHASLGPLIAAIKVHYACTEILIEEMPTLGQVYPFLGRETAESPFVPYPSPQAVAPLDSVTSYLHSSGSTGLPKPIPLTHRSIQLIASLDLFPDLVSLQSTPRLRLAAGGLPSFHATGVVMQFIGPLYHGLTACIAAPSSLSNPLLYAIPAFPTPQSALQVTRATKAAGILTIPVFLAAWAKSEQAVQYLSTLRVTMYTGGPLSKDIGDKLVKGGVRIAAMYGSTEIGIVNTLFPRDVSPSEWAWMQFSKRITPRWSSVGDGTAELQCLTVPTHLPNITNLSALKLEGYATEDLFMQHPAKPHLYRIVGRLDDVIIMANGEKTVPGPMEDVISGSPYISSALMFGREQNQVGVLVEPSPLAIDPTTNDLRMDFPDLVWAQVQAANEIAPAFAKVYPEMILIVKEGRQVVRTMKGTVVRKATIALYEPEIRALYDAIETNKTTEIQIEPPISWAIDDLERWLLHQACHISSQGSDSQLDPAVDLFEQGFDSLQATFLRHRIAAVLPPKADLESNFVYANPTIVRLARAIHELQVSGECPATAADPRMTIEAMIARHSQGLNQPIGSAHDSAPSRAVVLLTGSTGGLGSHLLRFLLQHPSVERVYAFNRPGRNGLSISHRQSSAFKEHALDTSILSSPKLTYLEGDSSRADLGLPSAMYSQLVQTVTAIIHNAWTLDFNKTLSSFEPHVRGTRHLIDLGRSCSSPARFLFTSSISSAQNWDKKRGPVPEEIVLDAGIAIGSGYGESKYVSERILAASGLPATSFRIGQICGSLGNGAWARTDWLPAIVKSSMTLGAFPSDPPGHMVVSWVPPEPVAQAIVDAVFVSAPAPAVNLVHPHPVTWDALVGAIANTVALPFIPINDWVARLEQRGADVDTDVLTQLPALKLLWFIQRAMEGDGAFSLSFATARAQILSPGIASVSSLNACDTSRWLRFWRETGFISF